MKKISHFKFISSLLLSSILFLNPCFSYNFTKLEKKLKGCVVDNRFIEGIPELGIMATSSSFVKFQRIFINPNNNKIYKIGKKGQGPIDFSSFPNVFSDGNFLYANDTNGQKIIVYNPTNNFNVEDILITKSLKIKGARVVGKFKKTWILSSLERIMIDFSKRKYTYKLKLWKSNDLKNVEPCLTITNLSKNLKTNTLKMFGLFLNGVSVVNVNNKGYIIINKSLNKEKAESNLLVYNLTDKSKKNYSFKYDKKLMSQKIYSGGFLGLDFNYYFVVYGEKENSKVSTVISSINLKNLKSYQFNCLTSHKAVFGAMENTMILQDIISDDINLEIVDTGKLISKK